MQEFLDTQTNARAGMLVVGAREGTVASDGTPNADTSTSGICQFAGTGSRQRSMTQRPRTARTHVALVGVRFWIDRQDPGVRGPIGD